MHTFGLYSALRACRAMVFRSSSTARLHVATIFLTLHKRQSVLLEEGESFRAQARTGV